MQGADLAAFAVCRCYALQYIRDREEQAAIAQHNLDITVLGIHLDIFMVFFSRNGDQGRIGMPFILKIDIEYSGHSNRINGS